MSRTRKDSQYSNTVLEIVKTDDGTFDLFLNRKLDRSRIPATALPEELCGRFGFCGQEYDSILYSAGNRSNRQQNTCVLVVVEKLH